MATSAADGRRRALSRIQADAIVQSVEVTHLLATVLGSDNTTNTDVRLLLAVHEAPGVTPSELAGRLDLSRSAVSRALRNLQADDLVARTRDPSDHRVRRLTLATTGLQRVTALQQQLEAHFNSAIGEALQGCAASRERLPTPSERRVTPLDALGVLAVAGTAAALDATAAAEPFGITSHAGRFAVSLIAEHDGLRPTELASALRLTSGGASQLIDRLEAERLVNRDLGVRDRRAVFVTLTERGERAAAAILDSFEPHVAAICAAFALADRAALPPSVASA